MPRDKAKAIVLSSGGLDSTTALAIALDEGYECHTLAFDYGQRHRGELKAAESVSREMLAESHKVVTLDLRTIGGSALTDDDISVPDAGGEGVPVTYVPARNTVFLSIALGYAEVLEAEAIYIGVNAVDYSGYPDCRVEYIDAYSRLAALATHAGVQGKPMKIDAPLIDMSKGEIIRRGIQLGVDYSKTVSCYQASDEGLACGRCDSCALRRQGFLDAGLQDPTRYIEGN